MMESELCTWTIPQPNVPLLEPLYMLHLCHNQGDKCSVNGKAATHALSL